MAKCPACEREVATPFVLNEDAWRWLVCPHCAARLQRMNPRYLGVLGPFIVSLIALGGLGHRYRVVSAMLIAALIVVILVEFTRPQLQLRKPLPKPEIELKINNPSS